MLYVITHVITVRTGEIDVMLYMNSAAIIFLLGITMARTLSIQPNHDRPCIVGDAWTEECKSCFCAEKRIAQCRPTFCASKLTHALDSCKEGQVTKVACNTCICRKNKRVCTKKQCPKVMD